MEEGKSRSKFKRVCVFCGSNSGNRQIFSDAALELGNELVKRKIHLVNGGGFSVLGVIPKALMPVEVCLIFNSNPLKKYKSGLYDVCKNGGTNNGRFPGETVGEVRTVSDVHERKSTMAREAKAFIALPGDFYDFL